jgi:ribosomal protein L40E
MSVSPLSGLVCSRCHLYNELNEFRCRRCGHSLQKQRGKERSSNQFGAAHVFLRIFLLTTFFLIAWYASLTKTSEPLRAEQRQTVEHAINILQQRGFTAEASLLRRVTTFRATDHWWNRQFGHPQAYAATNFPFEVMTLYPDFFTHSVDDIERAAILLHESHHLRGAGEEKAHAEVWQAKDRLGYTADKYGKTRVWTNMRDDTMTYAPKLFTCGASGQQDCTDRVAQ